MEAHVGKNLLSSVGYWVGVNEERAACCAATHCTNIIIDKLKQGSE
jgi:hypothetical protein